MAYTDYEHLTPTTRTLIVHPFLKNEKEDRAAKLEEAKGLAEAINLEVVEAVFAPIQTIRPATYIGKGKVEEFAACVAAKNIKLAVIDTTLTPVQQRNLEDELKCKVIDRTALILEIFGARAATREGKLQVELAAMEYQKGRLVRAWTHLERQRGGFGFTGGPGETQIELDRRKISDRIASIKGELSTVVRTRELHRKNRRSVPYPIVALVGYTNAGKSTLFNRLTGAEVLVEDMLFATLDPTMRRITLPSGMGVILSDTVGFISDLPTELVAAFRATLEEVVEAHLLLHVRDIASPHTDDQKKGVEEVLEGLGVEDKTHHHTLEVWNKTDLLPEDQQEGIVQRAVQTPDCVAISALNGTDIDQLLRRMDAMLSKDMQEHEITLDSRDGKRLAWLHEHGEVTETRYEEDKMMVRVKLSEKEWQRFGKTNPYTG